MTDDLFSWKNPPNVLFVAVIVVGFAGLFVGTILGREDIIWMELIPNAVYASILVGYVIYRLTLLAFDK